MKNLIVSFVTAIIFSGCNSAGEDVSLSASQLQGSWLLYERGYSPGGGYITEQVNDNPPRTITFSGEKFFRSTVGGFEKYKFFRFVTDSAASYSTLTLYESDPGDHPPQADNSTFIVELSGNKLKLMQIGCIEGCHLGFRRGDEEKE